MLRRVSIPLLLLALLVAGSLYYRARYAQASEHTEEAVPPTPGTALPGPTIRPEVIEEPEPEPVPEPEPEPEAVQPQRIVSLPAEPASTPAPAVRTKEVEEAARQQRSRQFWQQHMAHFDQLMQRLETEQDPGRRMNLIRNLARYVRFDTAETLDWAMGLEDPEEQRAALEAINNHALSGIGARIGTDDQGRPVIQDTTPLGAIEGTGRVQPGDVITGIVNPDGSTTYLKDVPLREVVSRLRGEPGSEIKLLLERAPEQGGAPQTYDLTVQRSLLVVQPPY